MTHGDFGLLQELLAPIYANAESLFAAHGGTGARALLHRHFFFYSSEIKS